MALRAGLYARYSTDMQREASIEDQLRICTMRAEQEGFQVYKSYADYGVSGATLIRSGIQSLLEDARSGKIDVIITESIDRLSRDQEDIAHIYKRMTLSEGVINELHVGLKGTMGLCSLRIKPIRPDVASEDVWKLVNLVAVNVMAMTLFVKWMEMVSPLPENAQSMSIKPQLLSAYIELTPKAKALVL